MQWWKERGERDQRGGMDLERRCRSAVFGAVRVESRGQVKMGEWMSGTSRGKGVCRRLSARCGGCMRDSLRKVLKGGHDGGKRLDHCPVCVHGEDLIGDDRNSGRQG